jgi:hypothetical protein
MMQKPISLITLGMIVLLGAFPAPKECKDRRRAKHHWIIGTWRSYKLDYGDFAEWKGTSRIELVAISSDEIGLFLISAAGKRSRAGDSQPSIMGKKTLFFGPIGSGLLFRYRHPSNGVLILDLKVGSKVIHAELRRMKT